MHGNDDFEPYETESGGVGGGVSQREHENSPHGRFHPVGG